MKQRLFTKSAFKQAMTCPASLYYYHDREHYANQNCEDDFLQSLADGGNQVGDLARLYYGIDGRTLVDTLDYESALKRTKVLFGEENVNIAEAAFRWENCFVRADIIEKKGKVINLIEVKAKAWEPDKPFREDGKAVDSSMREYLYDLAFQKHVVQKSLDEMYPGQGYMVRAYLMVADKSAVADGPVNQYFKIEKDGKYAKIVRQNGAEVLLDQTHVLTAFYADDVCKEIIAGETPEQHPAIGKNGEPLYPPYLGGQSFLEFVEEKSEWYCNHERHFCALGEKCFRCPFYSNEKTPGMRDGKKECYAKMSGYTEEQLKKPQVDELNGTGLSHQERSKLMAQGKYFLEDFDENSIPMSKDSKKKFDGVGLSVYHRRLVQAALAGNDSLRTLNDGMVDFNGKFIKDDIYLDIEGLRNEMEGWNFPLHMIDFETTSVALPLYGGMSPYGQVAFQYSHHIIDRDEDTGKYTIRHASQYINDRKNFNPNIEFLQHLYRDLKDDNGSIFRYSNHENTILRTLRRQMLDNGYDGEDRDELIAFIDSITHPTDDEKKMDSSLPVGERDMKDLWVVVKKYYMHRYMKGSNSIKQVLPSILKSSAFLQDKYGKGHRIYGSAEIPSLNIRPAEAKDWITLNASGEIENPYKHLDAIAKFLGVSSEELAAYNESETEELGDSSIANGGAALAAYTKLQFSSEEMTGALKEALLRYCELDTMSMVFIWEYFNEMLVKSAGNV